VSEAGFAAMVEKVGRPLYFIAEHVGLVESTSWPRKQDVSLRPPVQALKPPRVPTGIHFGRERVLACPEIIAHGLSSENSE
jgi:hypothetical protein